MGEIKVSVYCLAYNHEKYIRKTLEGFVNQKTDFEYEIIVHDDASTDGTARIIKEYEQKYPNVIKGIYQTQNQSSMRVNKLKTYIYPRLRGVYIAMCEGDDYWSDDQKLQLQYDALEGHEDCSFSVHKTQKILEDGTPTKFCFPSIEMDEGVISNVKYAELELVKTNWLFQTSSYFFRRSVIEEYLTSPYIDIYPMGDSPKILTALLTGNCYYIKRCMSCYRISNSDGSTMGSLRKDASKEIHFSERVIEGHESFDAYSKGKFHNYIQHSILYYEIIVLKDKGCYREILNQKYHAIVGNRGWGYKLFIVTGSVFPTLTNVLYVRYRKRGRKIN